MTNGSKELLIRLIVRNVLTVLFVTVSFLFSPKANSQNEYCDKYFEIGKHAGFIVNIDSYEYVSVAANPGRLLEQNSLRQSRPLFVIIGSALGYVLFPLVKLAHLNIYQSCYLGFVLLNFIVIILSVFLLDAILETYTTLSAFERQPFTILFISNNVTKLFFWSANTQCFDFLTPVLCVYLLLFMWKADKLSQVKVFCLGFFCGLGLLIYGNFALLAICFFSALIVRKYPLKSSLPGAIMIILPTVMWLVILRFMGVSYYNHEMAAYHQFVWIQEYLSKSFSAFAEESFNNLITYIKTFNEIFVLIIFWLLVLVLSVLNRQKKKIDNGLVSICFYVIVITFLFFGLCGFYPARLTYTFAAPLLILSAFYYNSAFVKQKQYQAWLLLVVVIMFHIYNVTKYGPFGCGS